MVSEYEDFKVKPFKNLSIIQTKQDRQLTKSHIETDSHLRCAVCGNTAINFEVIIKTTAIITAKGEIERIDDSDVMLTKPLECPCCNSCSFTKIVINKDASPKNEDFYAENEDFYGQRVY